MKIHEILLLGYLKIIIRSFPNKFLGRIIYYNDSGLIANIVGNYILKRDKVKTNKDINNYYVEKLKKDGIVIYEKLVGIKKIENCSKSWNNFCNTKKIPLDSRLELSSDKELNKIKDLKFFDLLNDELIEIIELYYQSNMNLLNIHAYRITTPDKKKEEVAYGETIKWHTDGSTIESIKIFVLLSDVTETDGPMIIMNLKDTKKIIIKNKYNKNIMNENHNLNEKVEPIQFIGKKGTVMIARTNECLHRATAPKDGKNRDMLTFYVTTSSINKNKQDMLNKCTNEQYYGFKRILIK